MFSIIYPQTGNRRDDPRLTMMRAAEPAFHRASGSEAPRCARRLHVMYHHAPKVYEAVPCHRAPPVPTTPRGTHAHLLEVAAARRLRSAERRRACRPEDAIYWKAVAPAAVSKACALRVSDGFAALP